MKCSAGIYRKKCEPEGEKSTKAIISQVVTFFLFFWKTLNGLMDTYNSSNTSFFFLLFLGNNGISNAQLTKRIFFFSLSRKTILVLKRNKIFPSNGKLSANSMKFKPIEQNQEAPKFLKQNVAIFSISP